MLDLLQENREAIADLCRRYAVTRLEVFGSAADGPYDPVRSDVDFLVEFRPGTNLGPWLTRYFELREALAQLLGRPVDLVLTGAAGLRNPHFAREVNRTRRLLYAA